MGHPSPLNDAGATTAVLNKFIEDYHAAVFSGDIDTITKTFKALVFMTLVTGGEPDEAHKTMFANAGTRLHALTQKLTTDLLLGCTLGPTAVEA
jgi:hypothetical protein